MLRTIYKALILFVGLNLFAGLLRAESVQPELRTSYHDLFSHKNHQSIFKKSNISCTECHNFSMKSPGFDPLSPNIQLGQMQPSRMVCHECHLGKTEAPVVNQCSLCHRNPERLAPPSHKLAWKQRHGSMAQMNPESCSGCHKDNQNSCANCHLQKNTLKPMVHRPNFRLTHSIEARANPAKCVVCHSNISTCTQCHKGGFK